MYVCLSTSIYIDFIYNIFLGNCLKLFCLVLPMARVFQSEINTNLHPSFFEVNNQPPVESLNDIVKPTTYYKSDERYEDAKAYRGTSSGPPVTRKALYSIWDVSPFSRLFFSKKNIDELQRIIRYSVYIKTDKQYIIGPQDETELVIIMRAIFLEYSNNPNCYSKFTSEINRLNNLVINQLLKGLISNVLQYVGYLKDVNDPINTIDRPLYSSSSGEKLLRSQSDVLIGDDRFFGASPK
jgi:uncharacterized protein DUF5761